MKLNIKYDELVTIFNLILKKLENDQVVEIELDNIEYWLISAEEWDIGNEKPELGVGSLADDWEGIKKCLKENRVISYIEFDRLSSILRAISQKQAPI